MVSAKILSISIINTIWHSDQLILFSCVSSKPIPKGCRRLLATLTFDICPNTNGFD